ncbi:MAG: M48 family metallopeptidase [Planctomycetes bacterium]|nr:M48 family metallopeptidase [Planctomycetota bacterium]
MAPQKRSSLAARAALAVALLIVFYVLAIAIAVFLVWWPFAMPHAPAKLILISLVGAAVIGWSLLPRFDHFTRPGPALREAEQPRLFAELRSIAARTRQSMPEEVYAIHDFNAFVAERGGFLGIGSRRVVGVGLPLLQTLTVSELRAVLAHEFGHFHGGDTKLGPWVYKTRSAIGRTIVNLQGAESSFLSAPFEFYGDFFVRTTRAIAREQELSADRLAASLVGGPLLAEALRKAERFGPAYTAFLQLEVAPVLSARLRPPLLSGFEHFVSAPEIATLLDRDLDAEEPRAADPFDSHPPLDERIAALATAPPIGPIECDARRGIELIEDVAALELELLAFHLEGVDVRTWPPIEWAQVGQAVLLPEWQRFVRENRTVLGDRTFSDVTALSRNLTALARSIRRDLLGENPPSELQAARLLIDSALAAGLVRAGWTLEAAPGTPVRARKDDDTLEPFGVTKKLAEDLGYGADFAALLARHGLSSERLAPPA